MTDLKPCPLCGSTDLKHYVTNARERNRGVIVCKGCGLRLEAYSDDEHKVAQAYQGDFESAHEFTWEQARAAVADRWNRRAERTCQFFYDEKQGEYMCSACGEQVSGSNPDDEYQVSDKAVLERFNFCPHCGAEVVSK